MNFYRIFISYGSALEILEISVYLGDLDPVTDIIKKPDADVSGGYDQKPENIGTHVGRRKPS